MKPFVAQRHRRRPQPTMHKFVNDLFNSSLSDLVDQEFVATRPAVNIVEVDNGFKMLVAIPGLSKDDLKIDVKDNVLTVSAELEKEPTEGETFKRKEFDYSNFKRSFKLRPAQTAYLSRLLQANNERITTVFKGLILSFVTDSCINL